MRLPFNLECEARYVLSMWVKTDGNISDLSWRVEGNQGIDDNVSFQTYTGSSMGGSSTWSQVSTDIVIPKTISDNLDKKKEAGSFSFWLTFTGNGTLYVDDINLKKAE